MDLNINITPDMEYQLQQAAQKAGLSPSVYVLKLIQKSLGVRATETTAADRLSKAESELLSIINQSLSHIDWQRYQQLIKSRQAETLSNPEHRELIAISEQLENANVSRIQAIAQLAELRHTDIDTLMTELELKPHQYA